MTRPSGARWSSVSMTSAIPYLSVASKTAVRRLEVVSSGPKMRKIAPIGIELDHVAEELAQSASILVHPRAGARHGDGKVAKVGQPQVAQQDAAVGVRVGPHPPLALGGQRLKIGEEPARLIKCGVSLF